MAVPYMKTALRGWTTQKTAKITTKTVVNHKVIQSTSSITAKINFQPLPTAKVLRKPEDQRTWKWWSIIIEDDNILLKTDDIITGLNNLSYRIEQASDWRQSGFSKYEAVEDYT